MRSVFNSTYVLSDPAHLEKLKTDLDAIEWDKVKFEAYTDLGSRHLNVFLVIES